MHTYPYVVMDYGYIISRKYPPPLVVDLICTPEQAFRLHATCSAYIRYQMDLQRSISCLFCANPRFIRSLASVLGPRYDNAEAVCKMLIEGCATPMLSAERSHHVQQATFQVSEVQKTTKMVQSRIELETFCEQRPLILKCETEIITTRPLNR